MSVAVTGFEAVRAPRLEALPERVRARAGRTERVTQLAFSAAGPALDRAGLARSDGDPRPRLGIVLGTAFGCFLTNAAFQRRLVESGPAAASPRLFAATVSNAAAGELAIAYRLGGPAITLTAGVAAGLAAIGHAVDLLEAGQADVLLAGGMDAFDGALERWLAQGGLGAALPAGEGAALLVLERVEHTHARNARVLALVRETTVFFRRPDATRAPEITVRSGSGPEPSSPRAPHAFAAQGPFEVVAALGRLVPGAATTVSVVCPSGHGAAVTVERQP
jgi:hypothetical protein